MRIIFFGSAEFAVPSLRTLHADKNEIAAVFTQPDRPAGRGREITVTPVKAAAIALNLPVEQPENLDDAVAEKIRAIAPDAAIIIAYGKLIPAPLLPLTIRGWLNLHPSLLPKYRGAAPVPHCILNGDAETGATVFRLNEKFDAGDILAVKKIPVAADDTSESLLHRISIVGADLLTALLRRDRWQFSAQLSAGEKSSYAKKFRKEDGVIDWQMPAVAIDRRVRAFTPWPLAHTFYGKDARQLTIKKCAIVKPLSALPSATVHCDENHFYVAAGDNDNWLEILEVIPEGKRSMSAGEFLRGSRLATGDKLLSHRQSAT